MSDGMKVYYWLNLILNPIILVLVALTILTEASEEVFGPIFIVGIGWALISGVINEKIRKWVLRALGVFFGGTIFVAIFGLIVAGIILAFVAAVFMIFGYLAVLVFLFFDSLITIRKVQQGLI